MSQLAIIIVNWNSGSLLSKCLHSLAQLPAEERALISRIVVADNNSSDDSLEQARKLSEGLPISFLPINQNIGFAAANNRGINALPPAIRASSHILLLNPDTEVHSGALAALLQTFAQHPKVGIAGPRLQNIDGSLQPSVRAFPIFVIFTIWFLKLTRLVEQASFWRHYMQRDLDYKQEQRVDQVMGAAFCIRNMVYQELGGLDERFWIWFEEVDYCQRAHAAGWEVVYTPGGSITHVGGASFDQLVGWRRAVPFLVSSLRYAGKYLSPVSVVLLYLLSPIAVLLTIPASLFHLTLRSKNKKRL